MNKTLLLLYFILLPVSADPQQISQITLDEFIDLALSESNHMRIRNIQHKINENSFKTKMHMLKPSISFNVNPSYNQSITGITQPDGSIVNHNISNLSFSPGISAKIPLSFSGGSISVSSSLGFYRNINPTNTYTNFTSNFYHIGISQPLSFFKKDRLRKTEAEARLNLDNLTDVSEMLKLKKNCVIQFLKFYKIYRNLQLLNKRNESFSRLIDIYNRLDSFHKVLPHEVMELKLSKLSIENNMASLRSNLIIISSEMTTLVGKSINITELTPLLSYNPYLLPDSCQLLERCSYIDSIYYQLNKIPYENNIRDANNNRKLYPTINMGIGSNSSASEISLLWKNRKPSYNISLGFSIPISDLGNNNRNYNTAVLNLEKFKLQHDTDVKSKLNKATNIYNNLISARRTLSYSMELSTHYNSILHNKETLLKASKISFMEYENSFNKYQMSELDTIDALSTIYEAFCELEILTLYDYINNVDYLSRLS